MWISYHAAHSNEVVVHHGRSLTHTEVLSSITLWVPATPQHSGPDISLACLLYGAGHCHVSVMLRAKFRHTGFMFASRAESTELIGS
jgi:hypothetical protein